MNRGLLVLLCAASASAAPLDTVVIGGVGHVTQEPDFCGEACVEMWARHEGLAVDQDDVFAATGLDPVLGRGAYTPELVRAVRRLGFRPEHVYTLVDAAHPQRAIDRELAALHADLERGVPSIVCMHYDDTPHTTEHFRLVVGFDRERDEIVYQEPAEDDGAYRRMSRALFEQLWQLPSSAEGKRVLVRIPLAPGKLVAPARAIGTSPAALAQHVMALREHLGGRVAIRLEPPFVLVARPGDAALARTAHLLRPLAALVDGLLGDVVLDVDLRAPLSVRAAARAPSAR